MRGAVKFGAIDAGSNSVRCLSLMSAGGVLEYIDGGAWITRITDGIAEGRYEIRPDALERTAEAVLKARSLLDRTGVKEGNRVFFATESLRSACNAHEVTEVLERASGLPLRVLGWEEEATLGRTGALLGTEGVDCIFDLGGGSLEVSGSEVSFSVPAGAVRMRSRFGEDADAIRNESLRLFSGRLPDRVQGLGGVGGTSSSIVMMLDAVPVSEYHPSRIHGRKVTAADLERLVRKMSGMTVEGRTSIKGLDPERADIILPGVVVIRTLLEAMGMDLYTHSETDILWAVCAEMSAGSGIPVSAVKIR